MSIPPTASNRAGDHRGLRAAGVSIALGAISLLAANSAFAAETTATILKKMADNYTKAKSYQVSITTLQSGKTPDGKAFTVIQTEHVDYQGPNRFHKSVKATGTGAAQTGQLAQQLMTRQGEIFSDGKTATMYVPARKMYQKQPVPPNVVIAQLVDVLRLIPALNRPGLTLMPSGANIKGRPAYVIEMKPTPPPNMKPDDQKKFDAALKQFKQYPRFMIDKQNFSLLEYTLITIQGTATVDLTSQVFGGSIPNSAFLFTPPAGVKEYKAPPPSQHPNIGGVPNGVVPGGPAPGGSVPGGKPK